jgi:hypothetical protein
VHARRVSMSGITHVFIGRPIMAIWPKPTRRSGMKKVTQTVEYTWLAQSYMYLGMRRRAQPRRQLGARSVAGFCRSLRGGCVHKRLTTHIARGETSPCERAGRMSASCARLRPRAHHRAPPLSLPPLSPFPPRSRRLPDAFGVHAFACDSPTHQLVLLETTKIFEHETFPVQFGPVVN